MNELNLSTELNQIEEEVMTTSNVVAPIDNQTQEEVMETSNVAVAEKDLLAELKRVYEIAINTPDFVTAHRSKTLMAIKSLTITDPEIRVTAQLKSHAEKKFMADAAQAYIKTGVFTPPSQEAIDAHIAVGLAAWRKEH